MRLQRAIANPRTSAAQIRAIARELPQVGLEDALAIVLALLDREPQSFSRAAVGSSAGARVPPGSHRCAARGCVAGRVARVGRGGGG
jgi:hypothetical protein